MPRTTPELNRLVHHSVAVIEDGQDASGAYVAAPGFPTYRYAWFRDGAFIADAMVRHGRMGSAARFHAWATGVIDARATQIADLIARAGAGEPIAPDEHLHTRYTVHGHEAEGFWENFQLDGYGTWLWALRRHHDRDPTLPVDLGVVESLVRYLATFWASPSYDWWEEHLQHRHVSTLGSIWAGLDAVAGWELVDPDLRRLAGRVATAICSRILTDGVVDGSLVKWFGSREVDASLVACLTPFELLPPDHQIARETVSRIDTELAPAGVHRYLGDRYYGGGQWILLAAFLGWHHLRAGDERRAADLMGWILAQADESGFLPEQVDEQLLAPDALPVWEQRWGPSASPLLWSHAMLLCFAAEFGVIAGQGEAS